MGKKTLRFGGMLSALALAVLFTVPATAQDSLRIAVVDLERVVQGSPLGQDLGQKLEALQQEAQTQLDALGTEARDLRQRLTDGANTLSAEMLADLQKQFEDKTIEMRRLRDDKQREGQKLQAEGLRSIEQQLEPVFRQLIDQDGYDLILYRDVVVMANQSVDITALVIERMNAAGAGAAGSN
ncbi:MAG: OmpH family outer membrane protein [Acidobacteriota bacterium]